MLPKKRKPQIKPNIERKPARKQPAKATVVENPLAFENVLRKTKLLLKEHPYKHGPGGTPKVIRDKMERFFLTEYIKKVNFMPEELALTAKLLKQNENDPNSVNFKTLQKIFAGTSKENVKQTNRQIDKLIEYMNYFRQELSSQCGDLSTELSHIIRNGEMEAGHDIKRIKQLLKTHMRLASI